MAPKNDPRDPRNAGQRAFDDAKGRARGTESHPNAPTEMVPANAAPLRAISSDLPPEMFGAVRDQDAARVAFAGMEMAPRFVEPEEGDMLYGRFVRFGETELSETEPDKLTGELRRKKVGTVILASTSNPRIKVEFLTSHELDRVLKGNEGKAVRLLRGAKRDTGKGGRQVTDWMIGFEP